jgi:hypothetical protein
MECTLHAAVGNGEECPEGWCAYWIDGGCEIERLQLDLDNHALSHYLLDLRRALELARDEEASVRAQRELTLLAPPDLSGA